jgi:peptide deformylase
MNIVQYPHPALRFVTRPIVRIDDALRHAAAQMLELMYEARGVGLAATQVALPWRMFVYNPTADPEKREHEHVILNPVIMEKRGSQDESEGCLSFPGMYHKVRRAKAVKVRIFQHETDHLSGILFIDKLGPIGRLAARQNLARLEAEYRDAQSMGEIPPDSELIQRLEALADGGSTPS